MLRPSTHSRSRIPNRNALMRAFASGSFSVRPRSTLTRRTLFGCARAINGQAAADVAIALMTSRRLIIIAPDASRHHRTGSSRQHGRGVSAPRAGQKSRRQSRWNVQFGQNIATCPPSSRHSLMSTFGTSSPVGCLSNGRRRMPWIPLQVLN